jgi:hypothetical protein
MEALRNLPSRGCGFTRVGFGLEPLDSDSAASPSPRLEPPLDLPGVAYDSAGNLRGYVCDHNAAPPAHQYITTDKTNVLIRVLTQKRSKDALAGRGAGASANAPRVPVGSSDHVQRPRGPPGLESRKEKAFFSDSRAAEASARRPATTGLERAAKRPNTSSVVQGDTTRVTNARVSEDSRGENQDVRTEFGGENQIAADLDLATLSVAQLRLFLNKRGVGGAAVAIAGKPQLLAQARTLLAKNDTK